MWEVWWGSVGGLGQGWAGAAKLGCPAPATLVGALVGAMSEGPGSAQLWRTAPQV